MQRTSAKGLQDYKCCSCGIALYKTEVASEIHGNYSDYFEHEQGEVLLKFCSECWGRIKETLNKDQGDAIMKRLELENVAKYNSPRLNFDDAETVFQDQNPFGINAPDDVGNGI